MLTDPIGDSFGIPGVCNPGTDYNPNGGSDDWVQIRAWTGAYSSYGAAVAGGAYAGTVTFPCFFANGLSFPVDTRRHAGADL